jgi:hypothetical protein
VQISLLTEMLHALGGQRVRIASDGGINPILLSDIDRSDFLGLQMPYQWPARATQAASGERNAATLRALIDEANA